MRFHSVVFARVLIGGLYSEPFASKAGVQWSWLKLFFTVHLEALFIPAVHCAGFDGISLD